MWDVLHNPNKLWVFTFNSLYFNHKHVFTMQRIKGSPTWISLMKALDFLKERFNLKIGILVFGILPGCVNLASAILFGAAEIALFFKVIVSLLILLHFKHRCCTGTFRLRMGLMGLSVIPWNRGMSLG